VYLRASEAQPAQSAAEMKREVNESMESAGYSVSWRTVGQSQNEVSGAAVVVVELRGSCRASFEPTQGVAAATSLGSTAVVNGELLPFSWVECGALSRYLSRELARESKNRREFVYGRAVGRVIAHELFHVLANTKKHEDWGIGKAAFSARDLLNETFQFEMATRSRIKSSASVNIAPTANHEESVVDETVAGR